MEENSGGGTARFIIDCLPADQAASITRAILSDPHLSAQFEVKMPAHFLGGFGLPAEVLTDRRATFFRNAACEKPAIILANVGDDEQQGLTELSPVGAAQLLDHPEIWVQVASESLAITDEHQRWWERALRGLRDTNIVPLGRFADYVLRTRSEIECEGYPVISALGAALPDLHLPKDTSYFEGVPAKVRTHASKWKSLYATAQKNRGPYLAKQNSSGLILGEDELRKAFVRVADSIPAEHHGTVEAFVTAPSGWNDDAAALAECEWEDIRPLFDGLRRERFNLGRATIDFYDEREPELLSDADGEYLGRLIARRTTEADDEDRGFYEAHRNELRDDRKLKSAWDRFVFGNPKESDDFLRGFATCLESLFSQQPPSASRRLTVRCDSRTKKAFRDLNFEAGLYFERRYKGVKALFGPGVTWDVGELFAFSELVKEWKAAGKDLNRSGSKSALQLKFQVELEVLLHTGGSERYATQMIWRYDPRAISSALVDDWSRLADHPFLNGVAAKDPVGSKGSAGSVDLANVKTFRATPPRDRGSFVPGYRADYDLAAVWKSNLETALANGYVSSQAADRLRSHFIGFQASYGSAVRDWLGDGLACAAVEDQAAVYAELLDLVCREAQGDRNRELLLKPLLQIGTIPIQGSRPAAVVAPWHPLRLAAMVRKARMLADLVRHLLRVEEIHIGDPRLYFNDVRDTLSHPFYPEVVLGWNGAKPELLALTDAVADYSLHESPLASHEGEDATNDSPAEGASQVLDLVRRYLKLHPHEQNNLSVVLYNCDSARLPTAVVEKMGALNADDEEVRCQVVLRHREGDRLRALYEDIVDSGDGDPDSYNASEATQDFMARLRISIMADHAPPPDPRDGCPADLVFSQDVVARRARVEWYRQSARPVAPMALQPSRWSRRRPASLHDMKSVVYLCCPVQSRDGWAYLTALTTFLKGDWDGDEAHRLLPARQLDFQDPVTSQIFSETHNLGNWVVNYDELLDRRQLMNQKVRVIRYKQVATQGRNLLVSSKAPLSLLRSMVLSRLRDLHLDLDSAEYAQLADRFIADANDVSGDIVLRAAKRGRNASELMGIVLSRYMLRHELGTERYYGWYFLDDYANWLGQREEQIADILALSPDRLPDGTLRLAVVVSEAKYIDASSLAAKRKESQKQLRDTLKRINEALFGAPHRLDRDLWLARLSDLLLDGIQFPAGAGFDLEEWRRALREGACEIDIKGYSHVFVSGPVDAGDSSDFSSVLELENAYQEVFGRPRVRDLVLRYHRGEDPTSIREEASGTRHWDTGTYRVPDEQPMTQGSAGAKSADGDKPAATVVVSAPSAIEESKPVVGPTGTGQAAVEEPRTWAYSVIEELLPPASESANSEADQAWLHQVQTRTRAGLQAFQLQAKLDSGVLTPNAALLKFAGSANLTVDQVLKRRSEFLTTHGLNVISVQPEPGLVALAIERPKRQVINLRDLWARWHPNSTGGNQDLLVGVRESDGSLLVLSPGKDHAPHTLIAGSTGSGKSVLMQNLILAIAATNTPDQARIVLIDPKQGVDYFAFETLPHLDGGIIEEQGKALERIHNLVDEMDRRYKQLREARAVNVRVFNERVPADQRMPVLWLIHDEFAEWMMIDSYKEEVTAAVARLGVKARAAGIHLIFAAQRPDQNVMPMQLRANLGNRLILRVDSEGTSEIALGERGAERLLGRGHLLASIEGNPGLTYAQVPFAAPEFIDSLVQGVEEEAVLHVSN
jgi:S-DNA-T family DNA segregation ATPase FtsK/SpoIIIE